MERLKMKIVVGRDKQNYEANWDHVVGFAACLGTPNFVKNRFFQNPFFLNCDVIPIFFHSFDPKIKSS